LTGERKESLGEKRQEKVPGEIKNVTHSAPGKKKKRVGMGRTTPTG